jgi:hypothetical protein
MDDQAYFQKFTALPALEGSKLFPHGFVWMDDLPLATPSLQAHIFFKTHTKTQPNSDRSDGSAAVLQMLQFMPSIISDNEN